MKKKLLLILMAIYLIAMMGPFEKVIAIPGFQSSEWWDLDWQYRVKVEVYSGSFAREDEPVELAIDFESLFFRWGILGTLDTKSIRVVDQVDSPTEVLSQFESSSGEIIWLTGFMEAGSSKTYYVYFDVLENGSKSSPSYYTSMEDGGILALPWGDHIKVFYKIGGIEYETARIDESNGRLCYFRPPFGSPLIEDTASRLGSQMEGGTFRGGAVSITGGPVRYSIKFHYEPRNPDVSDVFSDYYYTFYYVPNGDEIKTKLNVTWSGFQSFSPQIPRGEWPAAFEMQEENVGSLHTAFLATDIDTATLYDIPSTWGPIDGDAIVSPGLSDNFWGAFGECGGIGIIPISPDYSNWCVDGYRDRNGWNWSAIEKSIVDFIDKGTYDWEFWIYGYDQNEWESAKDFGNRVEEPMAIDTSFDQSSEANAAPGQTARKKMPIKRETPFFSDLEDKFYTVYPDKHKFSVAWLPPGWDYRKSHTINGSPVGLLSDYAIRIVVHYGSGIDSGEDVYLENNCRTDFGDVRFSRSDGSTQLDYWIEERTDGDNAIFWVEVNSIPASPGSATIYIYYGNSTATTTSNGNNTFDWFDDFESDSSTDYDIGRHTTIWHGLGAYNLYYDPVNRRVAYDTGDNFTGGWMVRSSNLSIQNFAAKVTFGVTGFYPSNTTNGILGRWTGNSAFYSFYVAGGVYTAPALARDARTTIIASPPTNTYHPFGGTPHTAELRIYGNSLTGIYNEGEADEVILTATDSTHAGAGQVEVIIGQSTGWFDFFFVRKYVDPEPSHGSWGGEEGIPAYFRVTGSASMTAGGSNELTITAYDANDNVATSYTGSQNLTFSGPSNAPDGTVPTVEGTDVGTSTAVNFTNGVSDAGTATLIAYMAETTTVDVTDGTIDSFADPSYDLDLLVNPGAANNLNFNQQPTNTVASSPITPAVTVEVRDQWNNVCTSDNTTSVGVAINNNPGGGTLSGTTPQTASSGVATFNDLSIDRAGNGYTLDATSAGLTTATSNAFNITAGTAGYFMVTGSASMTAGGSNELTITAYDANDNVATGYSGAQNLTFSGPSSAPDGTVPTVEGTDVGTATAINFTNGVSDAGAATLVAYRAETTTVDVTDGTIDSFGDPSYDLDLLVNPGVANNLNFSQQPTDTVAGAIITPAVTIEVRDQWNNVCTSDNTTSVAIAINNNPGGGTLSGTTPQTASSGMATFNDLSIDRSGGGYTLDATSAGLTTVTSNAFNITAGTAGDLRVTGSASMTAGGSNELTITAYDVNDNVATGYTGSQNLTFSGPSNAPDGTVPTVEGTNVGTATAVNFTNGVSDAGAATLVAYRAETTTVDVIDGTIDSFADPSYDLDLLVNPGVANNLNFSQQPTDTVAGAAITPAVTVEVRDQWNNVCTSDNTTSVGVTINNNPGGGTLSGTTPQTASSGIATFNDLSIDRAGNGYTLDATSVGLTTATSNTFDITAGTASRVVIEDIADGTGSEVDTRTISSGQSFTVYAIARDASDNFVGNVAVSWNLIDVRGGVVSGDLVAAGDNRSAIFTGHVTGTARMNAQHGILGNDATGIITVTAGTARRVVIEDVAGGTGTEVDTRTIASAESFTVYAISRDANDNFVGNVAVNWSLTDRTGGVVPSDLAPSGDNRSAAFTGHAGGTARIRASHPSLGDDTTGLITVTNQPPVALFEFEPKTDFVPREISFDASASYDPDGHIVSYEWDFGDGGTGSGVNPSHTYTSKGEYLVTLKVTDNDGLTDTATTQIKVQACFPPINVSLKREINRSFFRQEVFHTVSWSPNPENSGLTIINYRIYRKEAGQGDENYQLIGNVSVSTFEYVDGYLDVSKKFVYVVTAVESSGHQSEYSSSVGN